MWLPAMRALLSLLFLGLVALVQAQDTSVDATQKPKGLVTQKDGQFRLNGKPFVCHFVWTQNWS